MTSKRGSFAVLVELDRDAVRRINARLLELSQKDAANAMRRGFGKWTKAAKVIVEQNAPFGRAASVEKVRGIVRPNVHLKFAGATRVKGYSRGLVVWAGVGIREISGSYLTPHWYLRWVENGHLIRRRATQLEMEARIKRGERKAEAAKTTIGRVPPNRFIRRSAQQSLGLAEPLLQAEITKAIAKANGR